MYIKELVLENFKSFGRKTTLPVHNDFTTISGPNGSGKSNIIDAILFGLGLARTRGIRARKLTDLIYNPGHADGSGNGDPPSEAQVTIKLDNTDRTLTRSQVESAAGSTDITDVETIVVRRRVKRTAENYYSYYYLNGRSVNLSDIQDLLGQAGITPEGYNVVMQGDVTGIINMTPALRREIIDEIAGVAEFDEKTTAAGEELETVADRIHEADLRIDEKESRLEQLDEEREAALEYRTLREERERFEGYRQAAELESKRAERDDLSDEIDSLDGELDAEREAFDAAQEHVDRLQAELAELNQEIERTGEEEQLRIKREIEEIKGEIDRAHARIESAEDRIEEAEGDRRQAFVKLDRTQERVEELDARRQDRKLEKARLTASIEPLETEREELKAELEETDTAYASLRDELQAHKEAMEEVRQEKRDAQHQQDRLLDEARRRSEEIDELEVRIQTARSDKDQLAQSLTDLENERNRAQQNVDQIEEVIAGLKAERTEHQARLEELGDDLDAVRQAYAELEAQASANGDNSYGRAVTTVLNAGLDGVHGTIGQLGGVPPEYAEACETAAGGRLANVVVDDDEVGARCIEHLKSRNAGRATFLPISEMERRNLPAPPDDDEVVDFAYNLVDFHDRYAGVFSYVLGATLVVESMDVARRYMGSYRMATLEGDLVERSGAMTGGSRSGSRYSFSKTGKGRLERLAEQINELEDERSAAQSELRTLDDRLDAARDRRADAVEQRREIVAEIETTERNEAEVATRIETLTERLEEKAAEREDVDEQMSALSEQLADADGRIGAIEDDIQALEAELADSKIPELTAAIEECSAGIAEREDQIAHIDGELNEVQLELEYAESSVDELRDDIEQAQNRKAEIQEEIADHEAHIEAAQARLVERREQTEELEAALADLKAERSALQDRVLEATDERDEQRAVVTELVGTLDTLRERAEDVSSEIDLLAAQVEAYDPSELPDHETVTTELDRLTREMEALEPVNMLAIDEYEAVEADLDTLTEQRAILDEERTAILERIEMFAKRKKETFMGAFEGINEHFEVIFGRLSNGSGSLHLENEDDPFDGGLTMEARPADKPIQRLDAMSGGEKSLTALAFIFAIQRYQPAPFYALDEIDAFLDAVNADRVGELLDELAANAQFIVVSHRSALLDRSSRAIGVTMHENNMSMVTGITLGDTPAEAPADD